MAQKKATGGGVKAPQVSPLVEELTQGGTEVPNVSVLVGYIGNASEEGRVRLYLTPDLSNYVEFSQDDLVRSEVLQEGGAGATAVWVRKSARLTQTQTLSREVQAEFLSGGIAQAYGGGFNVAAQSIITNNTANIRAITGNNGGGIRDVTAQPTTESPFDVTGIVRVTITMTYVAGVTQGPRCGGQ